MLQLSILLVGALFASSAWCAIMPDPGKLAEVLTEDEFEDYLDKWLEIEELRYISQNRDSVPEEGCVLKTRGDLGLPQPVYLRSGTFLSAAGNTGYIFLSPGEEITISCTGSGRSIGHPNIIGNVNVANATCISNSTISGEGWLSGNGLFGDLTCNRHAAHEAHYTGETCYNGNSVVRVGYTVDGIFHPHYHSCFDKDRLEVLYVWFKQSPDNAIHQTGVDRPSWLASTFFPGAGINKLYTQASQKQMIAELVGDELASNYVTSTQYLARGHLTAKSDYVFATGQRATFYFINAAPQWQLCNAGNWNYLEQNLRARVGTGNYHTTVYTGTFGVTQLRDQNNNFVDIYLARDANNNPQLPVPLYFYKVIYDTDRMVGTAFVTINNPYYTLEELKSLQFCTDHCRNNPDFEWLRWEPDNARRGYSFCCDINEFSQTVPHLPPLTMNGLLF